MKNQILAVSLVFLLCFSFGCRNKAEKAELEKFRAQAKSEEQNKEIVKRFFEGLNKGSVEMMEELYAPEYRWYYSSTTPQPMTREKTIEFFAMFFESVS